MIQAAHHGQRLKIGSRTSARCGAYCDDGRSAEPGYDRFRADVGHPNIVGAMTQIAASQLDGLSSPPHRSHGAVRPVVARAFPPIPRPIHHVSRPTQTDAGTGAAVLALRLLVSFLGFQFHSFLSIEPFLIIVLRNGRSLSQL